jgi:glycerol-3-phosphate dehydrogenase (NAD(P)+)
MPERFTILGSGAWGLAMAVHLAKQPNSAVTLWSARPATRAALSLTRENDAVLPNVKIADAVRLAASEADAVADADHVILAVPTVYLSATLARFVDTSAPRRGWGR